MHYPRITQLDSVFTYSTRPYFSEEYIIAFFILEGN